MFLSQIFSKTSRDFPKDEESINAQLLIRAGFIDKVMAGVYTFLPLGWRVIKKIEGIIREEMVKIGGQEILMPTLQPSKKWEESGRWETYDSLFRFRSYYSKNDYVLGPTHEEIVTPLMRKSIFSYKDLPVAVFQIQNKFRDEARAKSGLLRGREFLMKDLYSFHTNEDDLDKYYQEVEKAYWKIFNRVEIDHLTYLTFASGGTFSKYSHEFQTLTSAGEDTVYLCEKCRVAVNREIIKEQKICPNCGGKKLKEVRGIEVGNIFKLKTKFSTIFNLDYKDEDGREKEVIMGCYGIGLNRLMGTIVEIYNDEKGIIWPSEVSPFDVHLIDLERNSKKGGGLSIYQSLQKYGVNVLYDDRKELSAGEKFSDADLIGITWRLVVSEKTGDRIEVKKRNEKTAKLVSLNEFLALLKNKNKN